MMSFVVNPYGLTHIGEPQYDATKQHWHQARVRKSLDLPL